MSVQVTIANEIKAIPKMSNVVVIFLLTNYTEFVKLFHIPFE